MQLRVGRQDSVLLFAGILSLVVVELIAPLMGVVGEHHSYRWTETVQCWAININLMETEACFLFLLLYRVANQWHIYTMYPISSSFLTF